MEMLLKYPCQQRSLLNICQIIKKLTCQQKIQLMGLFKILEILQGLKSNFFLTGAKIKMR
jgi:hypothetical protein